MIKAFRVLAYVLAAEVVVQAMAVAYGIVGLGKWVDDGHVFNKQLLEADSPDFPGAGGFAIHGMNGMMLIPILTLALLIVSFFAKVPGAIRKAAILVGLVILQVVLGLTSHSVPALAPLHVLNAFGILAMALSAGYRTPKGAPVGVAA